MNKYQRGSIYLDKRRRCWFARWYEDVTQKDGTVKRVQKAQRLCDHCDKYRTEKDVRPLLDDILRPLNARKVDARSTMAIADFVDNYYLPYVKAELKPSTHEGYRKLWKQRVKVPIGALPLRDFTTKHAHDLLTGLRDHGLGRRSIYHARALLSGILSYAINLGVLNGTNPVSEVKLPRTAAPPLTEGYTAQETQDMLDLFDQRVAENKTPRAIALRAKAAIGLMFFAGLRPGESRGVTWCDYDAIKHLLTVNHSVWRSQITDPKTPESVKPVPVIEPLRSILAELRAADGNPTSGPILRGMKCGRPLDLEALARHVVVPALREAKLTWKGWYACRRGIGTILATVTRDANASKGLLRHSSLATTLQHYVLDVPEVTLHGMAQVEQLFAPVAAPADKNHAARMQQAEQEDTHSGKAPATQVLIRQ